MTSTENKRIVIVSFEGLSGSQFLRIQKFMPKFAKHIEGLQQLSFDSRPFVSSQPIWAQILTGKPWYENGCAGYSTPGQSVNRLHVSSEKDLLVPLSPLFETEPGAAINLPILVPRSNIAWLSDGSMPIQHSVMPRELADQAPFSTYQGSGYVHLPVAMVIKKMAVQNCFEVEKKRLDCAVTLAKDERYRWIALQISIFDLLAHLFRDTWLDEPKLWIHKPLEEFLRAADDRLATICDGALTFIMSTFSHQKSISTINLSLILKQGGFLTLHGDETVMAPARASARRAEALAAITGSDSSKVRLQSAEGLVSPGQSTAASPVYGCIYINDVNRFSDGCVQENERQRVRESVFVHVRQQLRAILGNNFEIHEAPSENCRESMVPDFVVYADGVEFIDALPGSGVIYQSKAVHSGEGFLYLPTARTNSPVSPVTLNQIVEDLYQKPRSQ